MKKRSRLMIFLIILSLILMGCSSTPVKTTSSEEKEKQRIEQQEVALKKYALDHGITDAVVMTSFDDFADKFTFQLQSKYQGKKIVFYSTVIDIYQEDGKSYLALDQSLEDTIFTLECDKAIIDNLLKSNLKYDEYGSDEIILTANIDSIKRMHYRIRANGDSQEGYDLDIDTDNLTEIKGKCLNAEIWKTN
ncbi:hypothetical protein [Desulfosporosinus metallidurans]|uniref:Lipoprotein n=1 Tax=Desulfosporosinus metallidurans TaxID=1888891 RepID=A0A1Q8QJK2_9FIRM|nr:hypothetical protein [Desulfosporosinus metallidurans]OLN27511.1 hypothetical protein DSOL_4483 [Desulfosporosinus metallidurans]